MMILEQALSEYANREELKGAHVGEAIDAVGEWWRQMGDCEINVVDTLGLEPEGVTPNAC